MIALWIFAFLTPLPAARVYTVARESGARGWLGIAVWTIEAAAGQLLRLARFLRDWHEFRKRRRQEACATHLTPNE